ncbi:hypothetical protein [Dermatobacter hominis]|uniref:hypothetical protein n=1 Tax=Dermatobacter hominis TaxID=2884263 RepID=UPI001D12335F|nr:hypothetical protein [Dermatobacter hominis]UDY35502.1 hypothetical protein LH044_19495 [Dermatobacter hominis]
MTSRRHRSASMLAVLGAAAVAVVLVLAGCSSDDDGGDAAGDGSTTTTTVAGGTQGPSTTGAPATAPVTEPVADAVKGAVPLGTAADLGGGVFVTLTAADDVDAEAKLPGETAGPAVAATLEVRNDSTTPFDLSTVAVTASYGDGTPAIVNKSEPTDELTGTVEPGDTAKGVYVFRAPEKEADTVVLEVQSGTQPNVLRFKVV